MASSTSTGARVIFKVGTTPVLFANAISYTVTHTHQPVTILGMPEVYEHAEVGYDVTFTCTMFRVHNRGAIQQGLRPRLEEFMRQPELTVTLEDRISGNMFQIQRVKCTQEDYNVAARDLSQAVLSFVGVKMNELDANRENVIDNTINNSGIPRDI